MADLLVSWPALSGVDPAQVGGLVVEYATAARVADHDSSAKRATATVAAIQDALLGIVDGRRPATPADTLPGWLTTAIAWRTGDPLRLSVAEVASIRALERFGLYPAEPGHHESPLNHLIAMLWLPADWSDQPGEQVRLTRVQAGRLVNRLLELETPLSGPSYSTRSHRPLVGAVACDSRSRGALIAAAVAGWDDPDERRTARWLTALVEALRPSDREWESQVTALQAAARSGRYRPMRRMARAALGRIGVEVPKRDRLGALERELHQLLHHGPEPTAFAQARIDPGVLGGLLAECGRKAGANLDVEPWELFSRRRQAIEIAVAAAVQGRSPRKLRPMLPAWVGASLRELVLDRHQLRVNGRDFACLRVIENSGLLKLDVDQDYVGAMLTGLSGRWWHWEVSSQTSIASWFAADPDLVERALWRIFDLSGTASVSLTTIDTEARRFGIAGGWQTALIDMSERGVLDRSRLLDSCLNTMATDWPPGRLRWFSGLLAELRPTTAEVDSRQGAYRRLVSSAATPVITIGLDALTGIDQRGKLDDDLTMDVLWPVLTSAPKTQALRGLRLLDSIRSRVSGGRPLRLLLNAVSHPQRDVQQAAAKLLVAESEVATLLRLADEAELDPLVRRQLGLPPADSEPEPQMVVSAVATALVDLPALRPVSDSDLLDRLAAVLERPDDPIELELVLDRLAQTTDATVLRPLTGRAKTILKRGEQFWCGDITLTGQWAGLVVAATGGAASSLQLPADPLERFLALRLREVEQILVGARPPRSLAATPDDPAGWVSPEALVARVRDADLGRPADLVAALLRLSPLGRPEALAGVRGSQEFDAVVRHALGARTDPSISFNHPDLWVAAARSRAPSADDPLLIARGLDRSGQGRALGLKLETGHRHEIWGLTVSPAHPTRHRRDLQPTALDVSPIGSGVSLDEGWTDWVATIWPSQADHLLCHRIDPFSRQIGWSTSVPTRLLRVLLAHPGRMGPLSALAVALGLSSGNVEERVFAADLLIDTTARGRLTTVAIAEAMAFASEPCILTRWESSLAIAAEGGAGAAVAEILTSLLPKLPHTKPGMYALLELLSVEQRHSGPVTDRALRDWLAAFSGSSKAARAARTLLA